MNSCCLYNNKISIYFLFVFPLLTWNKEVPANQFVVRFYMLSFSLVENIIQSREERVHSSRVTKSSYKTKLRKMAAQFLFSSY